MLCANVSYVPSQLAVEMVFTIDGKVFYNQTESALNPTICVPAPEIPEVTLCFEFSSMQYSTTQVTGCVALKVEVLSIKVGAWGLGCFVLNF